MAVNTTEKQLLRSIKHHFGLNQLRDFINSSYGEKQNLGRSANDAIDFLEDERIGAGELKSLIYTMFETSKHHTFVFESAQALNQATLTNAVRNFNDDLSDFDAEIFEKDHVNKLCLTGLVSISVKAQKFDQAAFEFVGRAKTFDFTIPFQVLFKPPYHLKIKIAKFVPSVIDDVDGTLLDVTKIFFDEDVFSQTLVDNVGIGVAGTNANFVRSDLTTALKAHVREQKIGAISVTVATADRARESRSEDKYPGKGIMIMTDWYEKYLLTASSIRNTKWYWLDGNTNPRTVNGLKALSIDASLGKISQDSYTKESYEELIDGLVESNN